MGTRAVRPSIVLTLLVSTGLLTSCGDPGADQVRADPPTSDVLASTTTSDADRPRDELSFQQIDAEGQGTWERIELPSGTEFPPASVPLALALSRTRDRSIGVIDPAAPTRAPAWVPAPPGHTDGEEQVKTIGVGLYATGREGWYRLEGSSWVSIGQWGAPVADDGEHRVFLAGSSYDQVPYELRLQRGERTDVVDDRWSVPFLVGGHLVTLSTDPTEVRASYTQAADLVIRRWDDERSAWVTTPGGPAILPSYRYAESAVLNAWVDGDRLDVCTPDGIAAFDPATDELGPATPVTDARCTEPPPGMRSSLAGPAGLLLFTTSTDAQGVLGFGLRHAPTPTAPSVEVPLPIIGGATPRGAELVAATPDGFVVVLGLSAGDGELQRVPMRYRPA